MKAKRTVLSLSIIFQPNLTLLWKHTLYVSHFSNLLPIFEFLNPSRIFTISIYLYISKLLSTFKFTFTSSISLFNLPPRFETTFTISIYLYLFNFTFQLLHRQINFTFQDYYHHLNSPLPFQFLYL